MTHSYRWATSRQMNPHEDVVAVELLSDNFQQLLDSEFESLEFLFDSRTLK